MLIPPLALAVGALGFLIRGHRRVILIVAIAAPTLSVLAFAAQFVPGGAESCTSSTTGPTVCQSLPAVSGWDGPLPYSIAVGLVWLSVAPLLSVRIGKWWARGGFGRAAGCPPGDQLRWLRRLGSGAGCHHSRRVCRRRRSVHPRAPAPDA